MKKNLTIGILCVLGSAVIFGFTPVLAAISYRGGNNGINMAFLRALLPCPVLLLIGRRLPMPTRAQWKPGLLAGCLSFGCTLLLYSSYEYLSPGLATTLHFLYPLYVMAYESVRSRKSPGSARIAGLMLGLLGSALFLERHEGGSAMGYLLALSSGVAYAAYMILLEREAQTPMPLYRLMLLISMSGVVMCGALGMAMGRITVSMTRTAWICAVSVALLTAIVGCVLFQRGVREIGDENAAIYSLLEPITSVLFSVWLLHDTLSLRKAVACALILMGLLLTSVRRRSGCTGEEG